MAPLGTVFVSALFVLCALFALSGAGVIGRMPLLTAGIYIITTLCLVRGGATLPLSLIFPEQVTGFSVAAGIIWSLSGVLFVVGYGFVRKG